MRQAGIGVTMAVALGLLSSAASAARQSQANGVQTGSAQTQRKPNHPPGLFPPNEPVPSYATGANGTGASLATPGARQAPNAGATGLNGSAGTSFGPPVATYGYGAPPTQR